MSQENIYCKNHIETPFPIIILAGKFIYMKCKCSFIMLDF